MHIIKVTVILTLLALTTYAKAGVVYSDYTKIHHIAVGSAGDVYLFVEGTEINPGLCKGSTDRYVLPKSHAAYPEFYALALGSYYSQHEIRAAISDQECTNKSPSIVLIFTRRP